ncbi:hypothetical protein [Kitasatospora sp. NPDC094016]|uniref:hypothetical protein n=1 Tax=Kitasatospora sp. NPDC094016 TaxID=3154986 RepID=UPI00332BFBF5
MEPQHTPNEAGDGAEPDFDRYAGSLAEIMERALDALEAEHDQLLDLTHEQRQDDEAVLSRLEDVTWPTRTDTA